MAAATAMTARSRNDSKKTLSPGELNERVAILKRFKELLQAQRDRFRTYLDTLDKQKEVIEAGNADDLIYHVELEEKIVEDIFSIQKVIDPLEEMYRSITPEALSDKSGKSAPPVPGLPGDDTGEVSSLKFALESLKAETVMRSEQNRELLAKRMAELRSEIKSLRANPYARRRTSFDNPALAAQIDIKG